jgi:RNA polymerase sigma-70 factor (ECF subfamily)
VVPVDEAPAAAASETLLALYPVAVREVYGFLVSRSGSPQLAEDLTAEAFLAAVAAVKAGTVTTISTGWLIVVARRRLVDHWRQQEREQRHLRAIADEPDPDDEPWEENLDIARARAVLATLPPHYRAGLTLRYLDGLSVAEVADQLERGLHATEGLLQRSRAAFRRAYQEGRSRGS